MHVETVTTNDRTLLRAIRSTLDGADDVLLCVAFVQEKGLHLLQSELVRLRHRGVVPRLLVTTTFQTTTPAALSMAVGLGVDVRVLNPGAGRTFHPKLYLGNEGENARAVIGSANLTGGLFANIEAAVTLQGQRSDQPIARAWEWARTGGAEPVPARMFNLAWERLRTHGTLSNIELLKDLRVHRSTAVCTILARLPQVEVAPGPTVVLRWR